MPRDNRQLRELANRIAKVLFTTAGTGETASRLAMMHQDLPDGPERMGAGWCETAVAAVILKHLCDSQFARLRQERDAMKRRAEAAEADWQTVKAKLAELRRAKASSRKSKIKHQTS